MAAAMDGSKEEDMFDLMSVKDTLKQVMVLSTRVEDEVERVKRQLDYIWVRTCWDIHSLFIVFICLSDYNRTRCSQFEPNI